MLTPRFGYEFTRKDLRFLKLRIVPAEELDECLRHELLDEYEAVADLPEIPAEPEIFLPARQGMGHGHHKYSSRPYARTARILHRRHIKRINHQRNQFLH